MGGCSTNHIETNQLKSDKRKNTKDKTILKIFLKKTEIKR